MVNINIDGYSNMVSTLIRRYFVGNLGHISPKIVILRGHTSGHSGQKTSVNPLLNDEIWCRV